MNIELAAPLLEYSYAPYSMRSIFVYIVTIHNIALIDIRMIG